MTNLSLSDARSGLEQLVAGWELVGLPAKSLEPAIAAMARHDEIQREMQAIRDNSIGPVQEIAEKIAAESVSLAEGVAEHLLATAGLSAVSAGSTAKRYHIIGEVAKRAALERLVEALRGDVVDVLVSAGDGLVADVKKLAPTLDGTDSAEAAEAAGSKVTKAWQALVELGRRQYYIGNLWAALERLGVVDPGQRPAEFRLGVTVFKIAARLEELAV